MQFSIVDSFLFCCANAQDFALLLIRSVFFRFFDVIIIMQLS